MKMQSTGKAKIAKRLCLSVALLTAGMASVALGTLIDVALDFPKLAFDMGGTTSYDSGTNVFSVDATPNSIRFSSLSPPRVINAPLSRVATINIRIDSAGRVIGGTVGDDLLVTGDVDQDGDFVVDYSGVLLTGEVISFGFEDLGGTSDQFDFLFNVTGGALQDYYGRGIIGVMLVSENSDFAGDFTVDFAGQAKGTLGLVYSPNLPAVTDWGMVVMMLVMLTGIAIKWSGRRQPTEF